MPERIFEDEIFDGIQLIIKEHWRDKMKKILLFFLFISLAAFSRGTFTDLKWGDNPDAVVRVLGQADEIDGNEMVYNQLKFLDITFDKLFLGFSGNKLVYWGGVSNVNLEEFKGLAYYFRDKYTANFDTEESDSLIVFKSVSKNNTVLFMIDKSTVNNDSFNIVISDMTEDGMKFIDSVAKSRGQ